MLDRERSREIRRYIRHILMAEWDRIGIGNRSEAADEYDCYVAGGYELFEGEHLKRPSLRTYVGVEVNQMEIVDASGQPLLSDRSHVVASFLMKPGSRFTDATT